MSKSEIEALIASLKAAEASITYHGLYDSPEYTPELKEAFIALWQACEDYQAAFESYSR